MIDDFTEQHNHKMTYLNCLIQKDLEQLSALEMPTRWELEMQKGFRFIKQGTIAGPLAPDDLPVEHLQLIVKTHLEFRVRPLVFQTDPSRMYTMAKIAIVDANVTDHALNVHLILHIPRVTVKNT